MRPKFWKNIGGLAGFLGLPTVTIVRDGRPTLLTRSTLDKDIYNLGYHSFLSGEPITIEEGLSLKRSWSRMDLPEDMEAVKRIVLDRSVVEELPSGHYFNSRFNSFHTPTNESMPEEDLKGAIETLDSRQFVRHPHKQRKLRPELAVLLLRQAIYAGLPTVYRHWTEERDMVMEKRNQP